MTALHEGFPYIGELPELSYYTRPTNKSAAYLKEHELLQGRRQKNLDILKKLKPSEDDDAVMKKTREEAAEGFTDTPRPLKPEDIDNFTFARRIGVMEWRDHLFSSDGTAGDFRLRNVDHETESLVSEATSWPQALTVDGPDTLVWMILWMLSSAIRPLLFKCDVKSAFRRCPIYWRHIHHAAVIFLYQDTPWIAIHKTTNVGAISSVHAWHRLSNVLLRFFRTRFHLPICKYVDDFFGCSRHGTRIPPTKYTDILGALLGVAFDKDKSQALMMEMVVLGARVGMELSKRAVSLSVDTDKMLRWVHAIDETLQKMTLSPSMAMKFTGRFLWAGTLTSYKLGRAYLKPLMAQIYRPLKGNRVGEWLERALRWWKDFLLSQQVLWRKISDPESERHMVTWSDASSSRMIGCLLFDGSVFRWTRWQAPEHLLQENYMLRNDHYIGVTELLGLVITLATFNEHIRDNFWTAYIDNDGVLHAVQSGGGSGTRGDTGETIAIFWTDLYKLRVKFFVARVESDSNPTDGPSRDDCSLMDEVHAGFCQPQCPPWLSNIWRPGRHVSVVTAENLNTDLPSFD